MSTPTPMTTLYRKLADLGFPRRFVRDVVLPSWWDDEAGAQPAGLAEAALMVSRHLGVDLGSLRASGAPGALSVGSPTKFKLPKSHDQSRVEASRSIAEQVARLAALGAASQPVCDLGPAEDVRAAILDSGAEAIGLKALVAFAWRCGVPVVYLDQLPKELPRMHGMAAKIGDRPVIVVSRKGKPAWLLFIVAHELGHIACGHVTKDSLVYDETVDQASDDAEEQEANVYALKLLTGSRLGFQAAGRWPNAATLAQSAIEQGRRLHIDPGHIVLNYAHNMGKSFYAVGNAALKLIEGHKDGGAVIGERMASCLDWSALPEAGAEYLARMTGVGVEN